MGHKLKFTFWFESTYMRQMRSHARRPDLYYQLIFFVECKHTLLTTKYSEAQFQNCTQENIRTIVYDVLSQSFQSVSLE